MTLNKEQKTALARLEHMTGSKTFTSSHSQFLGFAEHGERREHDRGWEDFCAGWRFPPSFPFAECMGHLWISRSEFILDENGQKIPLFLQNGTACTFIADETGKKIPQYFTEGTPYLDKNGKQIYARRQWQQWAQFAEFSFSQGIIYSNHMAYSAPWGEADTDIIEITGGSPAAAPEQKTQKFPQGFPDGEDLKALAASLDPDNHPFHILRKGDPIPHRKSKADTDQIRIEIPRDPGKVSFTLRRLRGGRLETVQSVETTQDGFIRWLITGSEEQLKPSKPTQGSLL